MNQHVAHKEATNQLLRMGILVLLLSYKWHQEIISKSYLLQGPLVCAHTLNERDSKWV